MANNSAANMEKITQKAMDELLEMPSQGPVVTIYAPMHKSASPPHMTEDQIRFKNLIHKAMELLPDNDEQATKLSKQLRQHLEKLLEDRRFWEIQNEGLLLCARQGMIRQFQLPLDTEEFVAAADTFYLAPVLGLLTTAPDFYVLAIAQNHPRLYEGDMYNLRPANIELPETLEASLLLDENPKDEHSVAASGPSMHTSAFNSRGGAHEYKHDTEVSRFFRMADRAITRGDKTGKPLIVAGTHPEVCVYKDISKYPRILSRTISGNYTNIPIEQLYQLAYAIAKDELVEPKRQEAIDTYKRLSGANPRRTASKLADIETAAEQGRVDTLILGMLRFTTDTVRDNRQPVMRITFLPDHIQQAIHRLALTVRYASGRILLADEADMPNRSLMVAVLRY